MEESKDFRTRKQKIAEFKQKAKKAAKEATIKTLTFVNNNKKVIIPAVGIIIGILDYKKDKKNDDHRKLDIYDRSNGCYWRLRRPLKRKEQREFAFRKETGESTYRILNDMRVLK